MARCSARACCASSGCTARSPTAPAYRARVASDVQRDLLLEASVERARADGAGRVGLAARASSARRRGSSRSSGARGWTQDGSRRRCGRGSAAGRARLRGRGRALPRLPRHARPGRPRGRRAVRVAGARRAARPAGRWGGTPVFVYGFDDFTESSWTRSRRWRALRRDVAVSLPYEAGRAAFRRSPRWSRAAVARWPRSTSRFRRSTRTTTRTRARPSHHVERCCSSGAGEGPPPEPGPAIRLSLGWRARRGRAGGRRGARAPADGHAGRRDRRRLARPGRLRLARGAGLRRLRGPVLDRAAGCRSPTRGSAAACSRCCAARSARARADDLLAYLRTPGRLEQPRLADRLEPELRREGIRSAEARPRHLGARRWPLEEIDRLARRADRGARRAARRGGRVALRRARTSARRTCSPGRARRPARSGRGARRTRRAVRRSRDADAAVDPPRAPHDLLDGPRGARGRRPAPRPRADRPPGGDPRAPVRGGVRARAPGGRVPAPGARPSRSSPTTYAATSPRPADWCCRSATTGSTASASSSTSARRAPSGCSC